MSAPLVSSECYDLAAIAVVLAVMLLAAIAGLCIHIRNAVLGVRLLEACGGDRQTAAIAIENVRAENQVLADFLTVGLAAQHVHVDAGGRVHKRRVAPRDIPPEDVQ